MEARGLKERYGRQLTFWGGGANTQQTLQFGTPEQVYREVLERIEIFNRDGGFIFDPVHNIQATTPTSNMLAMFKAIKDGSR
jgi:uroporphyrinogen-III decarboxylase